MPAFSDVYDNLLWLTLPLLVISLVALVRCIVNVVRLIKKSLIVRVPLAEALSIEFAEAGKVVLCLEGPRFSNRFARLKYRLEEEDGSEVPWSRRWFRAVTSGVSTVRMELRTYRIPYPGRFVFRVEGLENSQPRDEDPRDRFVFMRPHLLKSIAYVIGMVLSSAVCITSLVFSLIWLFDVQ